MSAVLVVATPACTYGHLRQGGDNTWREDHGFERGRTTVADLLRALGPPTQVLELGPRTAFLYTLQERRTDGFDLLGLFRDTEQEFLNDRAVYFFDAVGRLEEMATSRVTLPRESEYLADPWRDYVVAEEGG